MCRLNSDAFTWTLNLLNLWLANALSYTLSSGYVGCFSDTIGDRKILNHTDVYVGDKNSVSLCKKKCMEIMQSYAGTKRTQCFCGDSLRKDNFITTGCDYPCPGNNSETCGGTGAVSVYASVLTTTESSSAVNQFTVPITGSNFTSSTILPDKSTTFIRSLTTTTLMEINYSVTAKSTQLLSTPLTPTLNLEQTTFAVTDILALSSERKISTKSTSDMKGSASESSVSSRIKTTTLSTDRQSLEAVTKAAVANEMLPVYIAVPTVLCTAAVIFLLVLHIKRRSTSPDGKDQCRVCPRIRFKAKIHFGSDAADVYSDDEPTVLVDARNRENDYVTIDLPVSSDPVQEKHVYDHFVLNQKAINVFNPVYAHTSLNDGKEQIAPAQDIVFYSNGKVDSVRGRTDVHTERNQDITYDHLNTPR